MKDKKRMSKDAIETQIQHGATAVITHRVSEAQQAKYEQWLDEIAPICRASLGLLDWHIIRPIKGLTDTYTVIIRYDTHQNLKNWMDSQDRKRLIAKVQALLTNKDDYTISSGLDFWFSQAGQKTAGQKAKVPVRWKQFLLTWSAIFPLVVCLPFILMPALRWLRLPENHYIDTLILTGIVVSLMVYVVMPRYTKLVQRWLFD